MVTRARTVVAAIVLAAAVTGVACSDQQDDPRAGLLAVPSTTSGVPTTLDPSLPPPPSPDKIKAEFDAAIVSKDFCAVVRTLDSEVPDVGVHAAVTATYQILADSTKAATAIVPPELAAAWPDVVEATRLAAIEAKRADGDINDPSIGAQFVTSNFDDAYNDVIAWSTDNCP